MIESKTDLGFNAVPVITRRLGQEKLIQDDNGDFEVAASADWFESSKCIIPFNIVDWFIDCILPRMPKEAPQPIDDVCGSASIYSNYDIKFGNKDTWNMKVGIHPTYGYDEGKGHRFHYCNTEIIGGEYLSSKVGYTIKINVNCDGMATVATEGTTTTYCKIFKNESLTEYMWVPFMHVDVGCGEAFSDKHLFVHEKGYVPAAVKQMYNILDGIAERINIERGAASKAGAVEDRLTKILEELDSDLWSKSVEGEAYEKEVIVKTAKLFVVVRKLLCAAGKTSSDVKFSRLVDQIEKQINKYINVGK